MASYTLKLHFSGTRQYCLMLKFIRIIIPNISKFESHYNLKSNILNYFLTFPQAYIMCSHLVTKCFPLKRKKSSAKLQPKITSNSKSVTQ